MLFDIIAISLRGPNRKRKISETGNLGRVLYTLYTPLSTLLVFYTAQCMRLYAECDIVCPSVRLSVRRCCGIVSKRIWSNFPPYSLTACVTKFLDEPLNLTVGIKRMGVQKLRISIEIAVFSVTERDRPIVTMDH